MLSYAKLTNFWQLLERAHISPSQFCLFYEMKHIGGKLMSDVHLCKPPKCAPQEGWISYFKILKCCSCLV